MRYLKRFNENYNIKSKPQWFSELKDFCETSLAYLLDDGYNVDVSIRNAVKYPVKNHVIVSLGLPKYIESGLPSHYYLEYGKFHWNDVKDYYIPFLQMLQRRYELQSFLGDAGYVFFNTEMEFRYLSLDQVINDKTGLDYPIWEIYLQIVDKI